MKMKFQWRLVPGIAALAFTLSLSAAQVEGRNCTDQLYQCMDDASQLGNWVSRGLAGAACALNAAACGLNSARF